MEQPMRFTGKTVVVTGGAGGLGSAMTEPGASFITSQLLCVDGGWVMR
jgi:FlaA1/EpsC-like NDP-sugar epimerase